MLEALSSESKESPLVGIVGDSPEVFAVLRHTAEMLQKLGVPYEERILSAHGDPDGFQDYAKTAWGRGLDVVIAGEKGNTQLVGMMEAFARPAQVIGVILSTEELRGLDSLASVFTLPSGSSVLIAANFDKAGAQNAAIAAAQRFVRSHPHIAAALAEFRLEQERGVLDAKLEG